MDRKMMVFLPLAPTDVKLGLELLKLWADLEDSFNPAITIMVWLRYDMKLSDVESEVTYAKSKFSVMCEICPRKASGWPAGCNGLECGAYEWFVEKNRERVIDFQYMLIAEADTLPTRKGWANEIMDEAHDGKVMLLGSLLFRPDCHCEHINGNMVINRDFWKISKKIFHSPDRTGWDAFIGQEAITYGTPSKLIWQDYRLGMPDNPWKGDDFIWKSRSYRARRHPFFGQKLYPAMLHGVKIMAGINAVRRKILGQDIPA